MRLLGKKKDYITMFRDSPFKFILLGGVTEHDVFVENKDLFR